MPVVKSSKGDENMPEGLNDSPAGVATAPPMPPKCLPAALVRDAAGLEWSGPQRQQQANAQRLTRFNAALLAATGHRVDAGRIGAAGDDAPRRRTAPKPRPWRKMRRLHLMASLRDRSVRGCSLEEVR